MKSSTKLFRYAMTHDYGLAPNPFGKYCTLAVCASSVRKNKNLKKGHWVLSFGGKKLFPVPHLVCAMQVTETLTFEQYWEDERFEYKKPYIHGSLIQQYGDNFYHKNKEGEWVQENSAHSLADGTTNEGHLEKDTGGKNVLIAKQGHFYYWGDNAIILPQEYCLFHPNNRDMAYQDGTPEQITAFIDWLTTNHQPGVWGDPANWAKTHKTQGLFKRIEYTSEYD